MIYRYSDRLGIENAYDRSLERGMEQDYRDRYDEDGNYNDNGYGWEAED